MRLFLALVAVLLSVTAASAFDLATPMRDQNGNPIVAAKEGNSAPKPLTLRDVCAQALLASYPSDEGMSGADKFKRGALGMQIAGSHDGNITLTAEEISMVKEYIGKAFGPLIIYQAWAIIDPAVVK